MSCKSKIDNIMKKNFYTFMVELLVLNLMVELFEIKILWLSFLF